MKSMQVKGMAIQSISRFVKKRFGEEGFIFWLSEITPEARAIFDNPIDNDRWYPLREIMIEPTANIARLFYNWDLQKAAWEFGRFSADYRFKGALKLIMKIPSPNYFIAKGTEFLPSYYRPCELVVPVNEAGNALVRVTLFPEMDKTTEFRIAGWIQRGLEINGCRDVRVEIPRALTRLDSTTDYKITWRIRGSTSTQKSVAGQYD